MLSRRQFCSVLAAMPLLWTSPRLAFAASTDVQLMSAVLHRVTDGVSPGIQLDVNWEFDLPKALLDCLRRSIALYFVYEFRLIKPRTLWFDADLGSTQLILRLSYSPLSRQIRLSREGLVQSFDTLDQALQLLKSIRGWTVLDLDSIENSEDFRAETRMKLDLSRLPKPLQVTIGGNSDWSLESDWEPVILTKALNRH